MSEYTSRKQFRKNDYTIGWICALPIPEWKASRHLFDEEHQDVHLDDGQIYQYVYGSMRGHNVVMGCLPDGVMGKASAAAVAAEMRITFSRLRFALLVGVGGGVWSDKSDVRLGDVVVSRPDHNSGHGGVIQYDYGKANNDHNLQRMGMLNKPNHLVLSALGKASSTSNDVIFKQHLATFEPSSTGKGDNFPFQRPKTPDRLFNSKYTHPACAQSCSSCSTKEQVYRTPRPNHDTPQVHYGLIASGDQVIKNARTRDDICRKLGGNVLSFEMEAAGMVDQISCLVIRGICDYCDSHKSKEWQPYAAAAAASWAKWFLCNVSPVEVVESVRDDARLAKDRVERSASAVDEPNPENSGVAQNKIYQTTGQRPETAATFSKPSITWLASQVLSLKGFFAKPPDVEQASSSSHTVSDNPSGPISSSASDEKDKSSQTACSSSTSLDVSNERAPPAPTCAQLPASEPGTVAEPVLESQYAKVATTAHTERVTPSPCLPAFEVEQHGPDLVDHSRGAESDNDAVDHLTTHADLDDVEARTSGPRVTSSPSVNAQGTSELDAVIGNARDEDERSENKLISDTSRDDRPRDDNEARAPAVSIKGVTSSDEAVTTSSCASSDDASTVYSRDARSYEVYNYRENKHQRDVRDKGRTHKQSDRKLESGEQEEGATKIDIKRFDRNQREHERYMADDESPVRKPCERPDRGKRQKDKHFNEVIERRMASEMHDFVKQVQDFEAKSRAKERSFLAQIEMEASIRQKHDEEEDSRKAEVKNCGRRPVSIVAWATEADRALHERPERRAPRKKPWIEKVDEELDLLEPSRSRHDRIHPTERRHVQQNALRRDPTELALHRDDFERNTTRRLGMSPEDFSQLHQSRPKMSRR